MHPIYQTVIVSLALLNYSIVRCHVPYAKPGFLSDSIHLEPELNDTIIIPCVIHDLGENNIRWWKDGYLIYDGKDNGLMLPERYTVLTNQNMLMVDWVNVDDSGNFTCQVILPYPRYPLEQFHTVRVRHAAKVRPYPPEGKVDVNMGDLIHIGCFATGWPKPVVKWLFKHKVIESLDERHKLIFTAEDPYQAGVYVCEATNNAGEPSRASIIVNIHWAPVIKVKRPVLHADVGMRRAIKCEVSGDPTPKVEWFFNKKPLVRNSLKKYQVEGDEHILTLRNIQDSDFGQYTCKAKNNLGEAEKSIELTGLANPAEFQNTWGLVAPDSYNFIWEVESYSPIIEYKLLFREVNNKGDWIPLIIPADINDPGPFYSKTYNLTGLKLNTIYQAQLISRNRYGWSKPSEKIVFASEFNQTTTEDAITAGSITNGVSYKKSIQTISLLIVISILQTFPLNL